MKYLIPAAYKRQSYAMPARPSLSHSSFLRVSFCRIVFEELFDQVDVCHDHASTAVSFTAQLVHRISIRGSLIDELQVALP